MSESDYTVGPFKKGVDAPAGIAALHLEIRRWQKKTGQNDFKGHLLGSQADLKDLEHYYIASGGNFFIAKDSVGEIIGFVGLRNDGDGHGSFKRLAVVPAWQRKGVGKALVAETMNWAKLAGFTRLSLQTHSREHARSLYEQFGFQTTGWVEERHDWLMECRL
jgi:GNAT superfamily N-acetyltransferase